MESGGGKKQCRLRERRSRRFGLQFRGQCGILRLVAALVCRPLGAAVRTEGSGFFMYKTISIPLCHAALADYRDWDDLQNELFRLRCDGVEAIWAGEPFPHGVPAGLVVGYHLTFYPDWLDFYREDGARLTEKFGSLDAAARFYGGLGREVLLEHYRADLRRAESLGARYVVFHVSDVSVEEGYTYRWLHKNREVIDASADIINQLLDGRDWPFEFLLENQWWPGFTFTDPDDTARLLDAVHFAKKGIMLDVGHLMNTRTSLATQAQGAAYVHAMLDRHGDLARAVRGVHLHRSLSGAYVNAHTGKLPPDLPRDYLRRFGENYAHILQIDRHEPWDAPCIASVIERIAPRYLTHELSASGRGRRAELVARQNKALCGQLTFGA